MYKRFGQALVVALLAVVFLGADTSSRFNSLGHKMMCACGCGQILLECNHVGCPDSDRMIGELRTQVGSGSDNTSVLNWFAAKYGATVLAAPIRGGFDRVAWITPLAVFAFATLGTAVLIATWKRRTLSAAHDGPARQVAVSERQRSLRDRIRRETEL